MKTPKIITIIKNISPDERKEFGKYLDSDFFKVEKSIKELYRFIMKFINKKNFDYTKEICKFKNYTVKTTIKKYTSLKNHFIKYLIHRYILKENSYSKIVQSEILLDINDEFLKKELIANLDEYFDNNPDTDLIKTIHEYKYYMDKFMYMVSQKGYYKGKGLSIQQDKNNKKLFDIYIHLLFNCVAQYLSTLSLKIENPSQNIPDSIMEIEKMIEYSGLVAGSNKLDNKSNILLEISKYIFNILKNLDDYNEFIKCKNFILINRKEISNQIFAEIIIMLSGIISMMLNKNKFNHLLYKEEALILEIFIKEKIFMKINSYLHPIYVRNYTINLLNNGKCDDIMIFLEQCGKYFYHEDREYLTLFILAHYYYGKKDFNLAQKYLTAYDNDDFLYKFDMMNLELKLYFEKVEEGKYEYFRYIHSILHNYDAKIKNTKFHTSEEKHRIVLLIKYLKKYLRLLENKDFIKYFSEDLIRLLKQVENEESFVMRKWMIEHLNKTITAYNIKIPPAKHPLKKKSV
jgi:hypothetical protein